MIIFMSSVLINWSVIPCDYSGQHARRFYKYEMEKALNYLQSDTKIEFKKHFTQGSIHWSC